MPEILPNPFTDPKKLPKRSLFDVKKDEKQSFIDEAMAKGLAAAQESMKKKFSDPELQKIWDNIEEKIESGEIKLHEITIGGKTKERLIKEIEDAGMIISDEAREVMRSKDFKVSKTEKALELIELSVADMGFPDGARKQEIDAKVKELGLDMAPAEVGLQLRLQYTDQPMDELLIGMDPISDPGGNTVLFYVAHYSNGRLLGCSSGRHPDNPWDGHDRFVFVRRK